MNSTRTWKKYFFFGMKLQLIKFSFRNEYFSYNSGFGLFPVWFEHAAFLFTSLPPPLAPPPAPPPAPPLSPPISLFSSACLSVRAHFNRTKLTPENKSRENISTLEPLFSSLPSFFSVFLSFYPSLSLSFSFFLSFFLSLFTGNPKK